MMIVMMEMMAMQHAVLMKAVGDSQSELSTRLATVEASKQAGADVPPAAASEATAMLMAELDKTVEDQAVEQFRQKAKAAVLEQQGADKPQTVWSDA